MAIGRGEEAYAMEELIAELGGSFLCADSAIGRSVANTATPHHPKINKSTMPVTNK